MLSQTDATDATVATVGSHARARGHAGKRAARDWDYRVSRVSPAYPSSFLSQNRGGIPMTGTTTMSRRKEPQ